MADTEKRGRKAVKKAIVLAVMLLCAVAAVLPTCAEEVSDKAYVVSRNGDDWVITDIPSDATAFFEYPQLRAGASRVPGTLTLKNETNEEIRMSLRAVVLPYDDAAAMAYFHRLHITVAQGEQTLYSGPYAGLGEMSLSAVLAGGESREYTVTMRCGFDYVGDPANDSAYCLWDFEMEPLRRQTETSQIIIEPTRPANLKWIILGAGVVIVVFGGLGLFLRTKRA